MYELITPEFALIGQNEYMLEFVGKEF